MDCTVGGGFNDMIHADDSNSTNIANSDAVFGDHAETLFHEDESHELQQAIAIDVNCSGGGNDTVILGPGDDLVSLMALQSFVFFCKICTVADNCFFTTKGIWR